MRIIVLAVALLLLFAGFALIERVWPSIRGQKRFRRGFKTDVAWFFWDPIVNRPITYVALSAVAVFVAVVFFRVEATGDAIRAFIERDTAVSRQPQLLQALELLVLFDFAGYWSHRWFHRRSWLWKYHAVHHSSEELDWLSSVRVHPVNELGQRTIQVVPLLILGFQPGALAGFTVFFTLLAIGFHANVGWNFGWFKYVVASPRFHRWHHTSEAEGLDRNFAGLFPWIDWLFGTLYMPKDRESREFGIVGGGPVPTGLWRQLLYPWRRKAPGSQQPATQS